MTLTESTGHRVLLVDDDTALATSLLEYLREHRFDAQAVDEIRSARELLTLQRFDAVLLEGHLRAEDGLVLARELAAAGHPPFLIVSSRREEADRVIGLELGAHDYIMKPFSYRELLARLSGVIRRATEPRRSMTRRRVARLENWSVDLRGFQARHVSGRLVELTPGELGVLRALLDQPRRVLLRHELLKQTRRDDGAVFTRTIDVLITRLRKKLEADPRRPRLITTVRGEGYRLDADVSWQTIG